MATEESPEGASPWSGRPLGAASHPDDRFWTGASRVPGLYYDTRTMAVADDELFISGWIMHAGDTPANGLVRYNLSTGQWQTLDVDFPSINVMEHIGDYLYVGGTFSEIGGVQANNIARFNLQDETWHALGDGVDRGVNAIKLNGDSLFVGGSFDNADGQRAFRLAVYDLERETWNEFEGGVNGTVHALAFHDGDLYVGGEITAVGWNSSTRVNARQVGRYNFSERRWEKISDLSLDRRVSEIAFHDDYMYIAGRFEASSSENSNVSLFARYNLSEDIWQNLSSDMVFEDGWKNVSNMQIIGSRIYIGGAFVRIGDIQAEGLAVFDLDTETWQGYSLGGVWANTSSFASYKDQLIIGGWFTMVDGIFASNVARLDLQTGQWHALYEGTGQYVNDEILAMAVSGQNIFIGGGFTGIGGKETAYVARFDQSTATWHDLDGGVNEWVTDIVAYENQVYVGGYFTEAGSTSAEYIARYDMETGTWHDMGNPLNGGVNAMYLHNDRLYLVGSFSEVEGNDADIVAIYDIANDQWDGLSVGRANSIRDIVVTDTDLYVAGFRTGIESTRRSFGRYNFQEEQWYTELPDINSTVTGLHLDGNTLYLSGFFSSPERYLIAYDITDGSYRSLADFNASVGAVHSHNGQVYAGGWFTEVNGNPYRGIVQIDSEDGTLTPMGNGLDGGAFAMQTSQNRLFVGGLFTMAGNIPAANFAVWSTLEETPLAVSRTFPDGHPVQVRGIVNSTDFGSEAAEYFIQDATAGLKVIDTTFADTQNAHVVAPGDSVLVTGEMRTVNAQRTVYISGFEILSKEHTLPDPVHITASDMTADSPLQGMRVQLQDMFIIDEDLEKWMQDGVDNTEGLNIRIQGIAQADTLILHLAKNNTAFGQGAGQPLPPSRFNVTGTMRQFGTQTQLLPFFADDFQPSKEIEWANLESPSQGEINVGDDFTVFARLRVDGITDTSDEASEDLRAWIGVNTQNVAPDAAGWTWFEADFNTDHSSDMHEFVAEIGSGLSTGIYYYASRFQLFDFDYVYGGYQNGFWDGETNISGQLTVSEPTNALHTELPAVYALDQNYPNPFNPQTTIRFSVPETSHIHLRVYNIAGQHVATLVNDTRDAGFHNVTFDGSHLSSGVYIYRMDAGSFTETRKLMLVK